MDKKFYVKSLLIWLSITPLAILNGGLRIYILAPLLGICAQPISGLILTLCIFIVSYIFIPRLGTANKPAYIRMGLLWVAATLVFETSLGIITGTAVIDMLQQYNVLTGNLWLFIVIFIGFVPTIVAKLRKTIMEK